METLVLVLGVLFAGLSAADLPIGIYNAEGVEYVGCFHHGRPDEDDEKVLSEEIGSDCANQPKTCLTPPTCISSCQSTHPSYVYVGLKYPGQCFCDSMLRGVNQTDSVDGSHCDGWCTASTGDGQLACGSTVHMLVYQISATNPPMTTLAGTRTTNSVGYKTETEDTTTNMNIKRPQNINTALIAGAATGGAAVLIVAGTVTGVCLWRKKSVKRRDDKLSSSLALQDVSHHCTSHPPSASHSNPTVPPNPSNIDALYAKPDKKRKQKKSSPDDPSYQDVIPTGAQNQYATVNDDHPPNSVVRQDPNTYDSIQNDPQYAVVNKRPKYRPNVDVNPIYMGGTDDANVSSGTTEMIDNVIYE